MSETIFALSSGHLPSAVAVIRLSGPSVKEIIAQLAGFVPKPRFMTLASFRSLTGDLLDKGLVVYFPAPSSFTGEDCGEFHLHGGKATVARFLEELGQIENCRLAEAGEFSRRAFIYGKFDLTEAEGLADLIQAETESQRQLALIGASGKLATLYRGWREKLIRSRALIEVEFDFSEEDLGEDISLPIWEEITQLREEIFQHLVLEKRSSIMRDGLKIVLVGVPNVGKSTFMNRLAGRNVSIVTEEPGTTRDALEIKIILGTVPVFIIDTAGIRETTNTIEKMGIDLAKEWILKADLILVIEDMYCPESLPLLETKATIWHIGNKSDLVDGDVNRWPIQISLKTGMGWDDFIKKLEIFCQEKIENAGSHLMPIRERHKKILEITIKELDLALQKKELNLEIRAEYLRYASQSLGRITGDIDVEDLLDVIFSEFCIGK